MFHEITAHKILQSELAIAHIGKLYCGDLVFTTLFKNATTLSLGECDRNRAAHRHVSEIRLGYFPSARVFCLPLKRYATFQSLDPFVGTKTYKPSLSLIL